MLTPQQHPSRLLSDYVLQLLSPVEVQEVERHLAACDECRAVVRHERQVAREVRGALLRATQPAPGRLRQLRPTPRPPRRPFLSAATLRPVAALAVLMLLFLGALQLDGPSGNGALAHPSQTSLAVTATVTPTATQAAEWQNQEMATAAAGPSVLRRLPAPLSTPLAAASIERAGS
ncbi:MAG TPA: zf-HC2 domain-containing protein [Candidatus Sulfomarinibacteraceae bacterium]|nr:zf-HC2 domain-containing protein [Candidatus Sulfomarinibacteraceae bacterium]